MKFYVGFPNFYRFSTADHFSPLADNSIHLSGFILNNMFSVYIFHVSSGLLVLPILSVVLCSYFFLLLKIRPRPQIW